jgi:hypothetical protein
MIKILKHLVYLESFRFIATLMSVKYRINKKNSILFTLQESGCSAEKTFSRTAGYPISFVSKGSQ